MRSKLKDKIPLDTPYVIQIFPVYDCNNKCSYCIHSTPEKDRPFISDVKYMEYNTFQEIISDLHLFKHKIKVLRFVGIGEPLLHSRIVDMIEYAKHADIAESIELLTNGRLLTWKMSKELNEAGLDKIIVSVQEELEDIIVKNVKMAYKQVPMQTVVKAFSHKHDKIFRYECNELRHETIVPLHNEEGNKELTQWGTPLKDFKVCPQTYYHMQINPDGNVVPCYNWEYPIILDNVTEDSLVNIWNGKKLEEFRKSGCMCNMAKYRYRESDNID